MNPPPAQALPTTVQPPRFYEFTPAQNAVFTGVARAMNTVGTIMFVLGVVAIVGTLANVGLGIYGVQTQNDLRAARFEQAIASEAEAHPEEARAMRFEAEHESQSIIPYVAVGVIGILGALIPLTVGRSLRGAARAFRAVAESTGSDIERVMDGVGELTSVYSVGRILVVYGIAIGVLAMVLALRALGPH
jgi:hypothetical protein